MNKEVNYAGILKELIDEDSLKLVGARTEVPNSSVYNNANIIGIYQEKIILRSDSEFHAITFNKPAPEGKISPTKIEKQSLASQMRRFFEERPFPDIIFKVQGQDIPAHKGFLTVKCSYFHKMFTSIIVLDMSMKNN